MARRRLLTDAQLAPFWSWAADERGIVQYYTLTPADLDLIDKKRAGANRLGFALLLCAMRFPGRILDVGETPTAEVLAFVAAWAARCDVCVPPRSLRRRAAPGAASLGLGAISKSPSRLFLAVSGKPIVSA